MEGPSRGLRVVLVSGIVCAVALAVGVLATRDRLLERWYLYRISAKDATVRAHAARMLGACGSERSRKALEAALEDDDPAVWQAACGSLEALVEDRTRRDARAGARQEGQKVTVVASDRGLVVVSAGEALGLRPGWSLGILRGSGTVALVDVIRVARDRSLCRVVSLEPGSDVRPGDRILLRGTSR